MGALLGVWVGSSAPAGNPGGAGWAAHANGWRGEGARGRHNPHCPSGPALPPEWRQSSESRPATLVSRRGAAWCALLQGPSGHLSGPAELGEARLQLRDRGLWAAFPLRGWRS